MLLNNNSNSNSHMAKLNEADQSYLRKSTGSSKNVPHVSSNLSTDTSKIEYLKNIILKYLEAVAMGNEFQTKILENVIFEVLKVSKLEKAVLDDKRQKSSFYYSWWYNAKSYLSSKIYGQTSMDDSFSTQSFKYSNPFNETHSDQTHQIELNKTQTEHKKSIISQFNVNSSNIEQNISA